jgi:IMP dehydrogenase
MLVKDLLLGKETQLYSINAGSSVEDAVDMMTANGIGAIIVMESEQPIGIFTESDLFKCHSVHRHRALGEIDIAEVMTSELVATQPDADIRQALALMTEASIHHLPVVQGQRIAGMLTIHELVKQQVETLTEEIHYLQDYISDLHNAEMD